jgi:hypothetical protein
MSGGEGMFQTHWNWVFLTLECQEVIGLRMLKAARGGAAAAEENALMWSEKTKAAQQHLPPLFFGGSLECMIDDYREIIQANALRLNAEQALT